ncbi:hypothetical protein GLOTRDRAFT_133360, partial [Gloeophyllum trabeum ATCC 11539]
MPKKRPSLQSIFVPSKFLSSSQPQSPTTAPRQRDPAWPDPPLSSRTRAFSEVPRPRPRPAHARQPSSSSLASSYADLVHHGEVDLPFPAPQPGSSPPSGDLLPDDPFANLSPGASVLAFPSPLPSPALPVPAPPPPPTPTPKRKEVLEKVAGEWKASGENGSLVPLAMDATDKESIMYARKEVEEKDGRLHVLVNNAGQTGPRSGFMNDPQAPERKDADTFGLALFANEDIEGWAALYKINTFSIFFVTTA